MALFRRRSEETMDGEVIDLAAMERRLRAARDKRAGASEYEHLVGQESVVRLPVDAVSTVHPSVWAQRQRERDQAEPETATWSEIVDVLAELRVQIEAYQKERLEFEAWARYQRAAIERERRALQADAIALSEALRKGDESD
jgi:hypothetical protein